MFPKEFISAMPAAAALPLRKAVGKLQKTGKEENTPIVAIVSAAIVNSVLL